jgi:hypothetical protein
MDLNSMYLRFTKLLPFVSVALVLGSCAKKSDNTLPVGLQNASKGGRPPAHVQKAWDARYSYDADRRLLVPEYAGSRWGAVQQFKEEGHLVYQDWWIRDVRKEELDASPDTRITSFLDEDGNLTESIFFADQNSSTEKEDISTNGEDPFQEPPEEASSEDTGEDPFEPSPFLPF